MSDPPRCEVRNIAGTQCRLGDGHRAISMPHDFAPAEHRPGFDDVDLSAMTVVELAEYQAQLRETAACILSSVVHRAYNLTIEEVQDRISAIEHRIAIHNVRETDAAEVRREDAVKDSRVEYARAVSARTRLEVALELARSARSEVAATLGHQHDATTKIDDVVTGLQIAVGRMNIAIPRIP